MAPTVYSVTPASPTIDLPGSITRKGLFQAEFVCLILDGGNKRFQVIGIALHADFSVFVGVPDAESAAYVERVCLEPEPGFYRSDKSPIAFCAASTKDCFSKICEPIWQW